MKKRNNTIQQKLFYSTTTLSVSILLAFCLLCLAVFFNFYLTVEKNSSQMRLDYMNSKLETLCYTMENYSTMILISDYIQEAIQDEYIDPMEQLVYTQFILNYVSPSIGVHSISLYDETYQLVVTSSQSNYTDKSLVYVKEESNSNNVYYTFTEKYDPTARQFISVLSMSRPIYSNSAILLGYVEICITEEELFDNFMSFEADSIPTFLVDKDNIIQSSNDKETISTTYSTANLSFFDFYMDYSCTFYNWTIVEKLNYIDFISPIITLLIYPILIIATFVGFLILLIKKKLSVILSPLNDLILQMHKIKEGDWQTIKNDSEYDDIVLLFDSFNEMIIEQERLKNSLIETESLKNKLSLDLLQEQIRPHFLYNTLENICSLAEVGEIDLLIKTVMNLSDFYRVSLSDGKIFVTIEEELIIIKSYLEIMQTRYFNRFNFNINCPDHLKQTPCIKLLLQPVIENSIYHGIKNSNTYGFIDINVFENKEYVLIQIKDNGTGIAPDKLIRILEEERNSFGLYSINTRIKCYYDDACGLHIVNNTFPETGTTVTIQIHK